MSEQTSNGNAAANGGNGGAPSSKSGRRSTERGGWWRAVVAVLTVGVAIVAVGFVTGTAYLHSHRKYLEARNYKALDTAAKQLAAMVRGNLDAVAFEDQRCFHSPSDNAIAFLPGKELDASWSFAVRGLSPGCESNESAPKGVGAKGDSVPASGTRAPDSVVEVEPDRDRIRFDAASVLNTPALFTVFDTVVVLPAERGWKSKAAKPPKGQAAKVGEKEDSSSGAVFLGRDGQIAEFEKIAQAVRSRSQDERGFLASVGADAVEAEAPNENTGHTDSNPEQKDGAKVAGTEDQTAETELGLIESAQARPWPVQYHREPYLLFCQSVPVTIEPTAGGRFAFPDITLCGMTRDETLRVETWSMPSWILTLVLVLMVGTIILWPWLKLRLMSRTEPLQVRDIRLLVLTGALGVGVATFAVALWIGQRHLANTLDADARSFAASFQDNFRRDLCAMESTVERIAEIKGVGSPMAKCGPKHAIPEKQDDASTDACVQFCRRLPDLDPAQWTDIALIGNDSKIVSLCAPRAGDKAKAVRPRDDKMAYRRYYRDAKDRNLVRLQCGNEIKEFALESIRTITRGSETLAVARELGTGEVLVGSARPRSVIDPVMPPGLAFAVIDESGRVQLHSDSNRNLVENFFEEATGERVIRSAIAARQSKLVDVRYHDRSHRVRVQPLEGLPWTLLVLRDRTGEDRMLWLVSLRWMVIFGTYFVLVPISLAVLASARRRYRVRWLWPDDSHRMNYWWACVFLVLMTLACAWIADRTRPDLDMTLLIVAPLLAILVLFLFVGTAHNRTALRQAMQALTAAESEPRSIWRRSCDALRNYGKEVRRARMMPTTATRVHASYLCTLLVLLVMISVLPSSLAFRDAWSLTVRQFVQHGQFQYLSALAAYSVSNSAAAGGEVRTPKVDNDGVYGSQLFGVPCPNAGRAPAYPRDFGRGCGEAAEEPCEQKTFAPLAQHRVNRFALNWLETLLPELPATGPTGDRRTVPIWTGGDRPTLAVSRVELRGRLSEVAESISIPGEARRLKWRRAFYNSVTNTYGLVLGLLLMSVFGLYALIKWAVEHLFVIGGVNRQPEEASSWKTPRIWIHAVPARGKGVDTIATISGKHVSLDLLLGRKAHVVDLRGAIGTPDLKAIGDSGSVLVFDHLDARMRKVESRLELLAYLEKLVFEEESRPTIALLSENDVLWWLSKSFDATETELHGDEERAVVQEFWRWSRLFDACLNHLHSIPAGATPTLGTLAAVLAEKASSLPCCREEPISEAASWKIWSNSTRDEKLAMAQLAREGVVNPNNGEVVSKLMERGLVYRAPAFRFFHRDFATFVAHAEPPTEVQQWESADGSWRTLQRVVSLTMVAVVTFLVFTQGEKFQSVLGLLGIVGAAIPSLVAFGRLLTGLEDKSK